MAKLDVRMGEGLRAALEERAVRESRSPGSVVRLALEAYLGVGPVSVVSTATTVAVPVAVAEPLGPSLETEMVGEPVVRRCRRPNPVPGQKCPYCREEHPA